MQHHKNDFSMIGLFPAPTPRPWSPTKSKQHLNDSNSLQRQLQPLRLPLPQLWPSAPRRLPTFNIHTQMPLLDHYSIITR